MFNFLKRNVPPVVDTSTQVLVATFVQKYLQSNNISGRVKVFVASGAAYKYIILITTKADKRLKYSNTIEAMIKANILRLCDIDIEVFWKFTLCDNGDAPAESNDSIEVLGLSFGGSAIEVGDATMEEFEEHMKRKLTHE